MVDVGMNDGFFTNLAASMNCRVISFELQQHCIDISLAALRVNGKSEFVQIINSPVSNRHNQNITVPYSDNFPCTGTYSFSRRDIVLPKLDTNKTFSTVTLQDFVSETDIVDFLKIDVEGHDVEVLEGCDRLFKSHQLLSVSVEVAPKMWTEYGESSWIRVYQKILGYNYSIHCLNPHSIGTKIFHRETIEELKAVILSHKCIDWNLRALS
jgi:FkbM family methyltransferase